MNSTDLIKFSAGRASVWLHRLLPSAACESVGILLYHRISPVIAGIREPDLNVTPDRFRSQLEGLLELGHNFCKLQDVLDCVAEGTPLPDKATIVTFDDGFENVYLNAWPALQDLQIPSTIFLNTAYLGSDAPFPCDPWGAEFSDRAPHEAFRPLTIGQCREMLATGLVELGAHTHTHDDFRGRPEALADDVRVNLRTLRDTFDIDQITFAFPHGRVAMGYAGDELTEAVRRVGVRCALTTECDQNLASGDSYSWGRCNVYEWDTPGTLQAKLAGWYSWAPKIQEQLSAPIREPVTETATTAPELRKPLVEQWHDDVQDRVGARTMRGGIGLVDQSIVSGSRFVATILLGRMCGADALGVYGLGFTFVVLVACIQNALVTLPYTVLAPRRKRRRSEFYAGSVFLLFIAMALLASLVLGLVSLTRTSYLGATDLARVFAAIAVVTPPILLWEFSRRFGFAKLNAGRVLLLDVCAAVAFTSGLFALAVLGRLSAASAYIVMGAAYGLVSAIWLLRGEQRFRFSLRLARQELLPHWRFGRWAFASETALMARGYIVPWMVAIWLDPTATGIFIAYATIVVLANPVLIGLSNVLAPDLAVTYASEGVPAVRKFVAKTTSAVSAGMLIFMFFLMVVGERIITVTYGSDFGGYHSCVLVLAFGIFAEAAGMPSYTGLWSIGRPNLCFLATVAGLVITVGLTAIMTPRLGITGAAIGYSSGKLVSSVLQVIAFVSVTRREWQGAVPV